MAFKLVNQLVLDVYRSTRGFPIEERYGLLSQLRRAAVSSAANIVEGAARKNHREFTHFLSITFGSLRETGYYIDLYQRLGYLSKPASKALLDQYDESARVLQGLIRSLDARTNR